MTKHKSPDSATNPEALTHNPFAALASKSRPTAPETKAGTFGVIRVPPVKAKAEPKPLPPPKLSLRLEKTGRSGKVVTRILGLPPGNVEPVAERLRKALGCGATIEGQDVVLLGSLRERAAEWLERAGDLRAIVATTPTVTAPKPPPPEPTNSVNWGASAAPGSNRAMGGASGTNRRDVRPGLRVSIVMKADQATGALTDGVVRELLTSSPTHPRGIKVRLESGEVGRVRVIHG